MFFQNQYTFCAINATIERMQEMRKLPIGIQSFENLRKDGYIYVDKSDYIYSLVHTGKVYFLSRPRRFGKSLFLTTLKAYFEGKKELFTGLKIESLEKDNPDAWKKYPVIYLNFAQNNFSKETSLEKNINLQLCEYEKLYEVPSCYTDPLDSTDFAGRFINIVQTARKKTGLPVVVLIDEYDKPLLDAQNNEELVNENRETLRGLYVTLKALDEDLKFVFLTGVTKFSKVSIFSDLNQLNDISLTEQYSEICGITEEEMLLNLKPEIDAFAQKNGLSKEECVERLEKMYDGYHFHHNGQGVYNPFSLLNALYAKEFSYYWFATGTPTFLIKKLQESTMNYMDFTNGAEATSQELQDYRNDNPNPIPLFYQTGYLTIKGYDKEFGVYLLKYPNDEVKYAFINSLAPSILNIERSNGLDVVSFARDIKKGDIESVMNRFKSLFALLPYTTSKKEKEDTIVEQNFQNVFYLVFTLLGQWSRVEETSSFGRADCVLENGNNVFIFEFKRDKSAEDALKQIEDAKYTERYKTSGRRIVKIGASFSTKERNLAEWKIVEE